VGTPASRGRGRRPRHFPLFGLQHPPWPRTMERKSPKAPCRFPIKVRIPDVIDPPRRGLVASGGQPSVGKQASPSSRRRRDDQEVQEVRTPSRSIVAHNDPVNSEYVTTCARVPSPEQERWPVMLNHKNPARRDRVLNHSLPKTLKQRAHHTTSPETGSAPSPPGSQPGSPHGWAPCCKTPGCSRRRS